MIIMGAADGKNKEIQQWALEQGACLLFSFSNHYTKNTVTVSKYSKNLSMLGEVLKGTFIKN
jgi:hypothetical protein